MKKQQIKKVTSAIMTFVLVFGVLSIHTGNRTLFDSFFSANAATSTVLFDSKSGILTLSGNVVIEDVKKWSSNSNVKKVICAKGTIFPEDCKRMFYQYLAGEIDLSNANTSLVTNMAGMFEECQAEALDLSSFNTSNVTNMNGMFGSCGALKSLDISSFDTSKVTDMSCMFWSNTQLELLDLSNFDTSNVLNMFDMFAHCMGLKKLDISSFDTSKVTDMSYMFYESYNLTSLDLSSFNTSNVTNMNGMFGFCGALKSLDISSFDTSKVFDMSDLFSFCMSLEKIFVSDKWTISSVTSSSFMFDGCSMLVGGNGTKYRSEYSNKDRAVVDTPDTPGYLTMVNKLKGASLTLDGNIGLNIYAYINNSTEKIVISGPAGDVIITDFSNKEKDGTNKFTYKINAVQAHDNITLKFYDKYGSILRICMMNEDDEIVQKVDYSVHNYLVDIKDDDSYKTNAKLKNIIDATENYCNAAENYFNGTKNVIKNISNVDKKSVNEYAPSHDKIKLSLVLNSATAMRIYTDANKVEYSGSEVSPKTGKYGEYYEIFNIPAQMLGSEYSVIIDETEYKFIPLSYVYRVLNNANASEKLIDMAKATFVYAKAAEDYVGE